MLRVAFDVGPLSGARTGIGAAVDRMTDSLGAHPVELIPYVTSFRARVVSPTRRLPVPAMLAHRWWSVADGPPADRWLGRPDVVHGTNYVVPPARCARLVSVYDCWFLRHPEQAAPAVRRAGVVLRRAVRRGAVVHASSHATADAVRELLPGAEVAVVTLGPLPVPAAATPDGAASLKTALAGAPFIVAIGTLERRKNLPTLVRAFAEVGARDHDVRLVIAGGDGDDRAAIDAAIAALPATLSRRIILSGRIDEPTKGWLLRNAAVLAYPSLDEGFGFPLLDAMQVSLPIVASDAGSIPEVAGDAALLGPADDIERLAAHLDIALHDDEVRSHLRSAGATRVGQHAWSDTASGLIELYRRLAERGKAVTA